MISALCCYLPTMALLVLAVAGMGIFSQVYPSFAQFWEKSVLYTLLAVSPMPSGHHKCGPHISTGTAPCPATQANPELEKSSLKTNKNPIYRYAPKADFEYPKRLWKFAKTTENGKKFLQVTYKVASTRLKNFQSYLMWQLLPTCRSCSLRCSCCLNGQAQNFLQTAKRVT